MNNFKRGLEPKKAIGIGLDQALKSYGITFDRNFKGEGRFRRNGWTNGLEVSLWSPVELRMIADYIEVNPDCKKIIIEESPKVSPPSLFDRAIQIVSIVIFTWL